MCWGWVPFWWHVWKGAVPWQEGWHRALPKLLDVPRVLSNSPASSCEP